MSLEQLFKRFRGQPIEILTDDGVRYCGIDLDSNDTSVEIIDKCSRVILISFRHIDAVVEPKMKLTRFCGEDDCDCDDFDEEEECECNHERERRRDNGREGLSENERERERY